MNKINTDQLIVSSAIAIVLISFVLMISGCSYYRVVTADKKPSGDFFNQAISMLFPEKKYPRNYYPEENLKIMLFTLSDFYLFDSKGRWHLLKPEFRNDTIFAEAVQVEMTPPSDPSYPENRPSQRYKSTKEGDIVRRINFYTDTLKFSGADSAYLPFSSIKQYDIYSKNQKKTHDITMGVVFAVIGAGLAAIIIPISIANYAGMTSCPFIYTYTGNDWVFNGEIFGGAVLRTLERNDYLALPAGNTIPGGNYKVKMANRLEEIQYINQADLLVVNHDSSVKVLVDKYGEVQTVKQPLPPCEARDSRGNDVLALISSADLQTCDFDEEPDTRASCMNYTDLAFTSDSNPDSCKILVKGHNTLWIDQLTNSLFEMMGKKYPYWIRYMDRKPEGTQMKWVLSQGLPLRVYLKKGQEWHAADYFDIVGPVAAREMVLPLDVRDAWTMDTTDGMPRYTLNIRLVTGYNFWEVDYAGLDLTENSPVEIIEVKPDAATDQDGMEVRDLLAADDDQYLVQEETGNEAIMEFTLPPNATASRSIFLHSKGYYHQVIEKNGNSKLAFIMTFLRPGRLSEWSYEQYKEASAASQAMAKASSNQQ